MEWPIEKPPGKNDDDDDDDDDNDDDDGDDDRDDDDDDDDDDNDNGDDDGDAYDDGGGKSLKELLNYLQHFFYFLGFNKNQFLFRPASLAQFSLAFFLRR